MTVHGARSAGLPPIGLDVLVETPENVELTFRLAGPALRAGAYAIDLFVRSAVVFFGVMVLGCAGFAAPGLSSGMAFVLYFLVDWIYYVLSEGLFHGKTIGKHLFHLRVIREGGYPITFWSALLRNFVRAADSVPLFLYGIGLLTMFFSGQFRRLGDLAARTLVIEEHEVALPREPVILARIQPLLRSELGTFVPSPQTLSLIEEFLSRRHVLTYRRGHAMALVLAQALAERLNYRGPAAAVEEYPMAFLGRVYATFHQAVEAEDEPPRRGRNGQGVGVAVETPA